MPERRVNVAREKNAAFDGNGEGQLMRGGEGSM